MKNTISLGQFELQLAEISTGSKSNKISQSELINELPNLFSLYSNGKELAEESFSKSSDLDGKSFSKRVNNLLIPQLSETCSPKTLEQISNEIIDAVPAAKEELDSIRTVAGGNTNTNVMALPVLPVVYGLIFLLGVAQGAANGKKKKK